MRQKVSLDRAVLFSSTSKEDPEAKPAAEAVEAFTRFLQWLNPIGRKRMTTKMIAARYVAAAWVTNPELLNGLRLRDVERLTRGAIKHEYVCRLAKEFEMEFGMRSSRRANRSNAKDRGCA